jgi:hypothetical protein
MHVFLWNVLGMRYVNMISVNSVAKIGVYTPPQS